MDVTRQAHENINQLRTEHPEQHPNDTPLTTQTPPELLNKPRSSAICTLCGNIVYRKKDLSRGEYVCEKCGHVMGDMMVSKSGEELSLREEKQILTGPRGVHVNRREYKKLTDQEKHKKIWNLQRKHEPNSGKMTEYRYTNDYMKFLQVVSGIYKMTSRQEQYVIDIINFLKLTEKWGLKVLCRKCSYKTIILALCLHSQGQDGRLIHIDKDDFCKELKITYSSYSRIRDHLSKVDRKASEYYRNHPPVEEKDLDGV